MGLKERRRARRYACSSETTCRVINLLDQAEADAGAFNLSTGGTCLVVDAEFALGSRLAVEMRHRGRPGVLLAWAEVRHALACPSFRDLWLTGCCFQVPLPGENVQMYV